jgi:diacylglycerol O-acyltransferase
MGESSSRVGTGGRGTASQPMRPWGKPLSRRLSPQDNFFLLLESDESPLNIGSVGIFEGKLSFDDFFEMVRSKMHMIPRYRQRIVPAPFNIARPTWEDDPYFDLSRHIVRVTLDPPGTHEQLMDLTARLYEGRLDRSKPLWELTVIEGLEDDRTAVLCKVHHCLVDGVSGVELLLVTMDVQPDPPPPLPPTEPYEPAPIPDDTTLFLDALFDNAREALDRSLDFQMSFARRDPSEARGLASALETDLPYIFRPMERAPFNGRLSGRRRFAGTEFPFDEVRAIRNACGGTVNDVVLAVLGGALGRYLELHGQETAGRSLRVMTPVNARREDHSGTLGNRISALMVDVPVGMADPVARLHAITEITKPLKESDIANGAATVFNSILSLPPPLLAVTADNMAPNTIVNMVCTNVPGPMIPLYSVGHRMISAYPLVPLAWELGLGCAVMSYDRWLYIGLVADVATTPDVGRVQKFFEESYEELRSAAGVARTPMTIPHRRAPEKAAAAEEEIGTPITSDAESARVAN